MGRATGAVHTNAVVFHMRYIGAREREGSLEQVRGIRYCVKLRFHNRWGDSLGCNEGRSKLRRGPLIWQSLVIHA